MVAPSVGQMKLLPVSSLGSSCSTWADVVGGQREACKCLCVWELLDLCVSGVKGGSRTWEIAGGAL